ncbi:MAG: indole-3-glycerol phosphate synthase TrpC [Alphaproteobacteria bacterium]|nr:MAG: indole-3-glycerol phosphate synthase TrpC [Alphaproteobacteria bacterium]
MSDVLARICADKRDEVAAAKARRPYDALMRAAVAADAPRGFLAALTRARAQGRYGVIAEIKRRSPSAGLIRADFDPAALARAYEAGGATSLSVLTDAPYFGGAAEYLIAARAACDLPVLRKDFMIDPWQVVEARAMGADCILVIMAAVDDALAGELLAAAADLGMDALVEVHAADELERALALAPKPAMIGINNRNLKTMTVDLATTEALAPHVPDDILLVAESGLRGNDDLRRCAAVGVTSFLIGESLMREADVTAALMRLTGEQ